MKTLLSVIALFALTAACSKEPRTEFKQEQQEANKEYREEVQDAAEERSENIQEAREDLNEAQKEEAVDYVEESDAAVIDRDMNRVDVEEARDQE